MDIFSLLNPVAAMLMEQGEIINGITNKMWIERFDVGGEFSFVAPISSGLKTKLPVGSFVSHVDTNELMIVENHEINDSKDEESIITVTGRGFETYFEQRVVGSNNPFPRLVTDGKFFLPANKTWNQVVDLIRKHLSESYLVDDNNALSYITVNTSVAGSGIVVPRKLDLRDLYSAVLELMKIDNLGIKIIRPGTWSPLGDSPNVLIRIHKGVDRRESIVFSYDSGKIVNADYLWSNKNLKTTAVVNGRWLQAIVHLPGGASHYSRRMMQVNAQDVDEDYEETELLANWLIINEALKQRGLEALKSQKDVVLVKAEISKKSVESRYRIDYNVGDLVSVVGGYNQSSVMRVSEFVEIEDENGTVAYPTLSLETEDE